MTASMVAIHELVAWGLDDYLSRISGTRFNKEESTEKITRAKQLLAERGFYEPRTALLNLETAQIRELLSTHAQRTALQQEYEGLDWTLGIVDLRHLLAFQRRLVFDPEVQLQQPPRQDDWASLFSLALGSARTTTHSMTIRENVGDRAEFRIQSSNPDLELRPLFDAESRERFPFSLYGGCPFFEVAEFRGRWFLRDGYHRAYRMLLAGVHHLPAVVIRARTIDEVGATQPWFFSEKELFSTHPPFVTDFLDHDLVLQYQRPRLIKTILIRIEESLEPIRETEADQGDDI